jgi:hypothetical protein
MQIFLLFTVQGLTPTPPYIGSSAIPLANARGSENFGKTDIMLRLLKADSI